MSPAQQAGATALEGDGWSAQVLAGPPLIAPARQFTFPFAVAGEEDALARGALWLQVRTAAAGTWLGQCALGYAGRGTAHGLWPLPEPAMLLACAGGYAYAIDVLTPERTVLLPARPAVAVVSLPRVTALVTHHGLLLRESGGELWSTPRLSWEGVTVTCADSDTIHGLGWNMPDDAEVAFTVDLPSRSCRGGGFDGGSSA